MALGAMVLIFAVYGVLIASQFAPSPAPPLPDKIVLYMDLKSGLAELPPMPSFADPFKGSAPTVREYVAAIDKAASDPRVKGIYARLEPGKFSLAHVQEIRAALARFKAADKFAHIYSQGYGDIAGGFGGYYLASAFDEIWLQPMGIVSITGMALQAPYARGALDKIGVTPEFFQRKEYKTAYESLMREDMSPENEEMLGALMASITAEFMADIPAERGMSADEFKGYVDDGLFTAKAAEQAKLVTSANYVDVLIDNIKEAVTGEREYEDELFVAVPHYLADLRQAQAQNIVEQRLTPKKPVVALIYAVGAIMSTGSKSGIAAADKIAPAIMAAANDDDVQAIVLRVDSPGGSPTASETILRAVRKAQAKDKPVIVSMGPTAASGGYWISAYSEQIFALPTTLTGSIGVVGGKFSIGALFDKMGVNWDGVQWGENANLWAINETYSEAEAVRVNMMLDDVYESFLHRVIEGRGLSDDRAEELARGRVWSGAQAVEIGLVDQLGGLTEALNFTAELVGAEDKNGLHIVIMPKPKTPLEQFVELIGGSGMIFENLRILSDALAVFSPALEEARILHDSKSAVYESLRLD